eukprot:scaffold34338_cov212-Skeletonema_marinoi.AAC.2
MDAEVDTSSTIYTSQLGRTKEGFQCGKIFEAVFRDMCLCVLQEERKEEERRRESPTNAKARVRKKVLLTTGEPRARTGWQQEESEAKRRGFAKEAQLINWG